MCICSTVILAANSTVNHYFFWCSLFFQLCFKIWQNSCINHHCTTWRFPKQVMMPLTHSPRYCYHHTTVLPPTYLHNNTLSHEFKAKHILGMTMINSMLKSQLWRWGILCTCHLQQLRNCVKECHHFWAFLALETSKKPFHWYFYIFKNMRNFCQ